MAVIVVDGAIALNCVCFDASTNCLDVMLLSFLDDELIRNLILLHEDASCLLTQAHLSNFTSLLNLFGDENTFAKDVIPDKLRTDDTCRDITCMNANSDVKLVKTCVGFPNLFGCIQHLDGRNDNTMSLFKHYCSCSL